MDVECPSCGHMGERRPGTPYPSWLKCPDCGTTFHEAGAVTGDEARIAAVACTSPNCKARPGERCRRKRTYGPYYKQVPWLASHRPRLVAAGLLSPLCPNCSQPMPQRRGRPESGASGFGIEGQASAGHALPAQGHEAAALVAGGARVDAPRLRPATGAAGRVAGHLLHHREVLEGGEVPGAVLVAAPVVAPVHAGHVAEVHDGDQDAGRLRRREAVAALEGPVAIHEQRGALPAMGLHVSSEAGEQGLVLDAVGGGEAGGVHKPSHVVEYTQRGDNPCVYSAAMAGGVAVGNPVPSESVSDEEAAVPAGNGPVSDGLPVCDDWPACQANPEEGACEACRSTSSRMKAVAG